MNPSSILAQGGALMLSLEISLLILVLAAGVIVRRSKKPNGRTELTCACGKQELCPWCKEAPR